MLRKAGVGLGNQIKPVTITLERADVKRLSEDVRRRRRFRGHIIRQPDNRYITALTWAPVGNTGGEVGQKQRGDVQWKGRGPEQGGSPGARYVPQRKTRVDGERIWRPYAPLWLKDLGNR